MRKNKKYDAELKINCIREVLVKHRSQREVARECDIAPWNIRSWIRKYEEYGEQYFYEEYRGKGCGNPFAALHTSKSLSREERLELENLKLQNRHCGLFYFIVATSFYNAPKYNTYNRQAGLVRTD